MAIITISRQLGSSGTDIAKKLQEELHYSYLDKESLDMELVHKYRIPEKKVEHYDEKKPAFWDMFSSDKDKYLHFMKIAMYDFARKGNCIIIGRGGQVLFKDIPGVLRVKVIAPLEIRIERVKNRYNYDDRLAEQIIRHTDHDRSGFLKFFFHVNWDDCSLYDLMINTHFVTIDASVCLIKDALKISGIEERYSEADSKIKDLCLAQEVETSILYEEKISVHLLEVLVTSGIVTIRGSVIAEEDIGRCETVARKVPGVKDVVNELYYIPIQPIVPVQRSQQKRPEHR
jgi:cytidylate kinase